MQVVRVCVVYLASAARVAEAAEIPTNAEPDWEVDYRTCIADQDVRR
jgi:hypothetical protein